MMRTEGTRVELEDVNILVFFIFRVSNSHSTVGADVVFWLYTDVDEVQPQFHPGG